MKEQVLLRLVVIVKIWKQKVQILNSKNDKNYLESTMAIFPFISAELNGKAGTVKCQGYKTFFVNDAKHK
jgi:hypothetical protein